MKKRKLFSLIMFLLCAFCLTGCGNKVDEEKERIKTAEEQALEQSKKAQEVVDKSNEQVEQLNETANAAENE